MPLVRFSLSCVLICIASQAGAQSTLSNQAAGDFSSLYPGAILIAPQQSDFDAPGIYRSVGETEALSNPLQVSKLCERDFELNVGLKDIKRKTASASGIKDYASISAGLAVSADFKIVKASVNADYESFARLETGQLRVISGDDDTSSTVLKYIKDGCRKKIAQHIAARRLVFIASTAIQTKDFKVEIERKPSFKAEVECGFWGWFCAAKPKVTVTAKYERKFSRFSPNDYVTIALVPAEIGTRQVIAQQDLVAPADDRYASAQASNTLSRSRVARGGQLSPARLAATPYRHRGYQQIAGW